MTDHEPRPGHTPGSGHEPTRAALEAAGHDVHGGDAAEDEHDVEEPLGPIDLMAWGAAILGALAGLAATAVFAVTVTR